MHPRDIQFWLRNLNAVDDSASAALMPQGWTMQRSTPCLGMRNGWQESMTA